MPYLLLRNHIPEINQIALLDPRLQMFFLMQCLRPEFFLVFSLVASVGQTRKTTLAGTVPNTVQIAHSPVGFAFNLALRGSRMLADLSTVGFACHRGYLLSIYCKL